MERKNRKANIIMLLVMAAIVAAGLALVRPLRGAVDEPQPSAAYSPEQGAELVPEGAQCTVEIRCDRLVEEKTALAEEKRALVPPDGVLLSARAVALEDGDMAFDALRRSCEAAGIALEYSYTPLYGSYYVEGIGNLYEFDAGEQSGWLYAVNGEEMAQSSSATRLADGDAVIWYYTTALDG